MTEISNDEVAQRLVRALRRDTVDPDRDRLRLRVKVLWPHYTHDRADRNAQAENDVWLRQVEVDDLRRRQWLAACSPDEYDQTMAWLVEMVRLGVETRRSVRKRRDGGLSVVEFVRCVARDWDWRSIAKADHSNSDNARRRWAGIVMVAADVANGRIGALRLGQVQLDEVG